MPSDKTPITLDPELDSWEQQPGESDTMFGRFRVYQAAGTARTVRDTAAQLSQGRKQPMSTSYLQNTASRFRWHQRARAWDDEQHRIFLAQLDDARRQMVTDQLADAAKLREILHTAMQAYDPTSVTASELARMIEAVAKVERGAVGEPDRTLAIQGVHGGPAITLAAVPADEESRAAELEDVRQQLLEAIGAGDLDALDPALLPVLDGG
jgi:hypothetical protein